MNDLIVAGKSLREFGIVVSGGGAYDSAGRSFDKVEVLGRTGEIVSDNGHWERVDLTYECGVVGGGNMDGLRAYIASLGAEDVRIEDTFHPEEFYLGYVNGGIEVTPMVNRRMFSFKLKFRRKGERWLKSGEKTMSGSGTDTPIYLNNPTLFNAYPKIRLKLTETELGYIPVSLSGGTTFRVYFDSDHVGGYITIDCAEMAFTCDDATDKTTRISWVSGDQPYIKPGFMKISLLSEDYSFTPNWYTI